MITAATTPTTTPTISPTFELEDESDDPSEYFGGDMSDERTSTPLKDEPTENVCW
jgi:hypothetical protein